MWKIILSLFLIAFLAVAAFIVYVMVTNRPLPQTEHDVVILERTIELLSSKEVWSRQDTRECKEGAEKLSLYCALRQASIDVTGDFQHRAAALQEVRYAIDRAKPGAEYAHRLMDYNNDPEVSLADVHAMLNEARAELQVATEPAI